MSVPSRSSKTRSGHRFKPVLTVPLIAGLIALTALAVSARGWLMPMLSAPKYSRSTGTPPPQAASTPELVEAEIVTITPIGFEPAEITRPAGRFILMVNNQSNLPEVTFRVDQENGNRLYEILLPQEQPEWSAVVDLQPGTYLLTEAGHADWLARITITAP